MKKSLFTLLVALLTAGLVACGDGNSDGLSSEEVYEKSFEAMEDMESATMAIDIEQEIADDEDFNMTTSMSLNGDIIIDTNEMHQEMDVSMGGEGLGGLGEELSMEFYLTEDAFYVQSPEDGDQWIKFDPEEAGMFDDLLDQQEEPSDQLEMLEEYIEDLSIEEEDGTYVLTLTADADGFEELIEDTIDDSMADDMIGTDFDFTEDMDIHELTYEMVIDKETFYLTDFTLDMDLTMTIDGDTADMKQTISASYDNINEIDSIEVPEDVVDNAIEQ